MTAQHVSVRNPKVSVSSAARFAAALIARKSPAWAVYHNARHTRQTVAGCREIGKALRLGQDQMDILLLAAWFHDTGYTAVARGHEARSAKIAGEFLWDAGCSKHIVKRVQECILATRMPQRPRSLTQRILCDADLISLGKPTFLAQNELLRQEIEHREGRLIEEIVWLRRSIRFLLRHRYTTRYGRTVLESGKQANIERVRRIVRTISTSRSGRN
jgi:predicted metal-dependent HD superfamily phosphohydrolase